MWYCFLVRRSRKSIVNLVQDTEMNSFNAKKINEIDGGPHGKDGDVDCIYFSVARQLPL